MTQSSFEDRINAERESIKASVKEIAEERDMMRGAIVNAVKVLRLYPFRLAEVKKQSIYVADNLEQSLRPDTPAKAPSTWTVRAIPPDECAALRTELQWAIDVLRDLDRGENRTYIADKLAITLRGFCSLQPPKQATDPTPEDRDASTSE